MRTYYFDTTEISNKKSLDDALSNLMDFPDWHGEKMSEWIDLVTVGQQMDSTLARFRKAQQELFVIELQQSLSFFERKRNLFKNLMAKIAEVNEVAVNLVGYPLLTLVMR